MRKQFFSSTSDQGVLKVAITQGSKFSMPQRNKTYLMLPSPNQLDAIPAVKRLMSKIIGSPLQNFNSN